MMVAHAIGTMNGRSTANASSASTLMSIAKTMRCAPMLANGSLMRRIVTAPARNSLGHAQLPGRRAARRAIEEDPVRVLLWAVAVVTALFWTAGAWAATELLGRAAALAAPGDALDPARSVAGLSLPAWVTGWI